LKLRLKTEFITILWWGRSVERSRCLKFRLLKWIRISLLVMNRKPLRHLLSFNSCSPSRTTTSISSHTPTLRNFLPLQEKMAYWYWWMLRNGIFSSPSLLIINQLTISWKFIMRSVHWSLIIFPLRWMSLSIWHLAQMMVPLSSFQ